MSAPSNEIEFSKQVRGALANLYDPAALRASGLCGVLADDEFGLRECLLRAIEAVKPAAQVDANARAWRAHRLLHLRYVEARNAVEVEGLLAMSTSQYYREQQAAIDAVVATLRRSAAGGGAEATNNPSAIRHNIPLRLTSFVGRQQEIEIVLDLIREADSSR